MPTLEQIEGEVWPEQADETTLMRKCRLLRRKDLSEFAAEDYRLLVGQGIALPILAPRVIALLKQDLLIGGDFYDGDLLTALLRPANWKALEAFKAELVPICAKALEAMALSQAAPETNTPVQNSVNAYVNTQV